MGDEHMTFSPLMYKINRDEIIEHYKSYFTIRSSDNALDSELAEARNLILGLWHYELLILQSSKEQWEELMNDPSLKFRRELSTKSHKLQRYDIMQSLNLTSGAVSNLFNESTLPKWPRPFQLSVLLNHPWQLVNYDLPDPYSYSESPEYFDDKVSKKIQLKQLFDEISNVSSISGYVITDAFELFHQESGAVTGRWVTTYQEFDYFEFHLNYEPLVDKVLRESVLKLFPQAKYMITTFRPFKSLDKRSIWVIIPKNETLPSFEGMLHELKEYRDRTEFHTFK